MKLTFGKYKGVDVEDVPLDYLIWFEENMRILPQILRDNINFEIARKTGDRPGMGRVIKDGK